MYFYIKNGIKSGLFSGKISKHVKINLTIDHHFYNTCGQWSLQNIIQKINTRRRLKTCSQYTDLTRLCLFSTADYTNTLSAMTKEELIDTLSISISVIKFPCYFMWSFNHFIWHTNLLFLMSAVFNFVFND